MQAGLHLYIEGSGSSMAVPHVAGADMVLARKRMLSNQPLHSLAEAEQTLMSQATDFAAAV